jgi:hypothetical protein
MGKAKFTELAPAHLAAERPVLKAGLKEKKE